MTSYIPSLTLPGQIFAQPAASILLPVALGTAVGFSIRRESPLSNSQVQQNTTRCTRPATDTQRTYLALKQPPYRPPPKVFGPMWTILYGLMGYAAYRAWSTGMSSFSPATIELTKVRKFAFISSATLLIVPFHY